MQLSVLVALPTDARVVEVFALDGLAVGEAQPQKLVCEIEGVALELLIHL